MKKLTIIFMLIMSVNIFAQWEYTENRSQKYGNVEMGDSVVAQLVYLEGGLPPYSETTDTVITIGTSAIQLPSLPARAITVQNSSDAIVNVGLDSANVEAGYTKFLFYTFEKTYYTTNANKIWVKSDAANTKLYIVRER